MFCCLFVIFDCFRWKKKQKHLYNQLIGTIRIFDLIYSFSIALGTLPKDSNDISFSRGEFGNPITCKIQGGAIQLGTLTSLFLNCALSTYYLLVVVYNVKRSRLQDIRKWLLGIPILCGTILGFSSIPFISNGTFGCHLSPPNPLFPVDVLQKLGYQDSKWQVISLLIAPAFLAIFHSTFVNSFMLYKIWKVDKKSQKWSITQRSSVGHENKKKGKVKCPATALTKLRREVFQQCFQYLAAVYLTWLLYLIITVRIDAFITSHYSLWALVFFLSGFQGFLNCMIYFQPRMMRYWRHLQKEWRDQQLMKKNNFTPDSIEIADEDKAKLNHTWSQIAFVEPAVDIITAFEDKTEPISQEKAEEENGFINIPCKQIEEVLEMENGQNTSITKGNECLQEECKPQDSASNQTPIC